MKVLVPIVFMVASSIASPVEISKHDSEAKSEILRIDNDVRPDGFKYIYESDNGIAVEAEGVQKKVDNNKIVSIYGSYRYTAPDGTPVIVSYIADETGYHPQSEFIPLPPPVPKEIQRALDYTATHPSEENRNK